MKRLSEEAHERILFGLRVIERELYAALCEAAEKGLPCPRNCELADRFGFGSISRPSEAIAKLERVGLIEVDRGHHSRRVKILRTGKMTAGAPPERHWRLMDPAERERLAMIRARVGGNKSSAYDTPEAVAHRNALRAKAEAEIEGNYILDSQSS